MYEPGSGTCQAKVGLLVLRQCGKPAVGVCGECAIQVCQKHQVIGPRGNVLCPDCAARHQDVANKGHVGRSRRRSRYYSHYGYHPYYYHHGHGYHSRDYDHMDERSENITEAGAGAEMAEAGAAAEMAEAGAGAEMAEAEAGAMDDFDGFDDMES